MRAAVLLFEILLVVAVPGLMWTPIYQTVKGHLHPIKNFKIRAVAAGLVATIASFLYFYFDYSDLVKRYAFGVHEESPSPVNHVTEPEGSSGATTSSMGSSNTMKRRASTPPNDIKDVLGKWCTWAYIFELSWDGKRYWFQRSFTPSLGHDSAERTQIYYTQYNGRLYFDAGDSGRLYFNNDHKGRVYVIRPDSDSLRLSFSEDGWYTMDGMEINLRAC